jgi:predicted MFS family arabinose efflux permease
MNDFVPGEPGGAEDRNRQSAVMLMLLLAYTLNFLDRQIIGILAIPIKTELLLSDAQLGLMGGLAFALFYTGLGIPIALLADRYDRGTIMTIALFFWSLMTAVCRLCQNFWQLFVSRLGVGVGEAGGVAPAYSLIADLYPAEKRSRALAIYSFGIPIGSASGIVFGGVIATYIDWRYAFFIVGLVGIVLAPFFRLVVHDPLAGKGSKERSRNALPFGKVLRTLSGKPSFWLIAVGGGCAAMMGYGLFFWIPSFLVRSFQVTLLHASLSFGAVLLVGGVIGLSIGGSLADRLALRSKSFYVLVPATAFAIAVPALSVGVSSDSLWLTLFLLLGPIALGTSWVGPVVAAVQGLVPVGMRSTASAVFLFVNNLIGIGLGTAAIGWLSDTFQATHGEESLRYAILGGTSFYVAAAIFLFIASRRIERDWHRA